MSKLLGIHNSFRRLTFLMIVLLAGCAGQGEWSSTVSLTGKQEVPPVATSATGKGEITVLPDRTVSGSFKISGVAATAAHIHEGPAGKNGPVIITLTKSSETAFTVPSGTKLTDSQYKSYKAGNLYVNVHSAKHRGGEIRAQIKPASPPPPAKQPRYGGY